jgi:hypothetical protein
MQGHYLWDTTFPQTYYTREGEKPSRLVHGVAEEQLECTVWYAEQLAADGAAFPRG